LRIVHGPVHEHDRIFAPQCEPAHICFSEMRW
jgi:hypothetical protein